MRKLFAAVAICAAASTANIASASQLDNTAPYDDRYKGFYTVTDAFGGGNNGTYHHGLYLPGLHGDTSWSVTAGSAVYLGTTLVMQGTVQQTTNNIDYFLDFNFSLQRTTSTGSIVCSGGSDCDTNINGQPNLPNDPGEDNIVYFLPTGPNNVMGTITGQANTNTAGLEIDVIMRPLTQNDYKPGQLGFGGDWFTDLFGYSNWMNYVVTSNDGGVFSKSVDWSRNGDVNFRLTPDPFTTPQVPVPAGLPLILTAFAGFYVVRRRKNAA